MPNKTINYEGRSISIPSDFSDEDIHQVLLANSPSPNQPTSKKDQSSDQQDYAAAHPGFVKAGLIDPPSTSDKFRYYAGRPIADHLPMAGAIAGGLASDGVGGIAGAGFGSSAKVALQNEFPQLFGNKPEDPLTEIATDTAVQGAIPEGLGKVASLGVKGLLGRTIGNISRYTKSPSVINKVAQEDASRGLEQFGATPSKEIDHAAYKASKNPNIPSEHAADGTVINDLRDLPRQLPFMEKPQSASYDSIARKALSDVSSVRNWKLATGESGSIRRLASNDLIKSGYDPASKTLDVGKVLKGLDGSKAEVYSEALGKDGSDSLRNFLASAQSVASSGKQSATDRVLNYAKGRFLLSLPAAALGAATGHGLVGAGSVVLSDAAISLLMKNKEVAQIASQAFRSKLSAPEAGLMNKVIVNALRGAEVYYTSPENKLEKAYMTDAGTITTMKPRNVR